MVIEEGLAPKIGFIPKLGMHVYCSRAPSDVFHGALEGSINLHAIEVAVNCAICTGLHYAFYYYIQTVYSLG